jgi:hypothetical protein
MLLRRDVLDGIVDGTIDRAFRRWRRPSVKVGTHQRTAVGIIAVTSLEEIALDDISEEDARRAGDDSAAEIRRVLAGRDGTVYRIGLEYAGPDPRVRLRGQEIATEDAFADVAARLARYDASSHHGPWTVAVLRAIAGSPGTPAAELAATFGRPKQPFKTDVRKLKELGLTESLNPGYRLSPRGRSFLERLDRGA